MLFAPPPPSSAGWNTSCTVPAQDVSCRQQRRGAEQRRGVAVMAAGMHHAGIAGGVGQAGGFSDRQRVHVGAQADAAVGLAAADRRHHAMAADAGDERNAEFAQPGADEGGGALARAASVRDARAGGGASRSMFLRVSFPCRLRVVRSARADATNGHAALGPPDNPGRRLIPTVTVTEVSGDLCNTNASRPIAISICRGCRRTCSRPKPRAK